MPFPDFEPSTPAFIRSLEERYATNDLIVYEGLRLTYGEAAQQSAQMARGMLAAGFSKGTRVGLLMPNSPDFVVAWLAAARIGAVIIPINTFYKPRELAFVLHHADIEVLLTADKLLSNDYLERLEVCAPQLTEKSETDTRLLLTQFPYLRQVYVWGESSRRWAHSGESLLERSTEIPEPHLQAIEECVVPADVLMIIYSSGSTADPKGAIHTQGSVIKHAYNLNHWRDLQEADRIFSPMPFFWVGGLVFTLYCAMHKGCCLISEAVFEPEKTLQLIESERATLVTGWPHYGAALADHSSFKERDLSTIRAGNIYALLPQASQPTDPELRSNALGMTETCGPHCIDHMDLDLPEAMRGSFGRAIEGVQHKIIDPDSTEASAAGADGELCVRGYNVMQGLYKVEREDCFGEDGFYRTGDAGYLNEDGFLFFKARLGDLIKTGGANVTPREVEIVIDEQAEVQCSYVVGLPHPDRGQVVAAAVILNAGSSLDAPALTERLKQELSAYKVPANIFFCDKGDIPFTDSGKIDKRRLTDYLSGLSA
ncbi:MAG: acyl-CoA synthetase (AMP-forming)/AMP-acid ligase II [Halioglobus sp.]|jgi:acyl-CoA synthetase (AMP-forming)/AMP-acid ligase II